MVDRRENVLRYKKKWLIATLLFILLLAGCSNQKSEPQKSIGNEVKKGGQLVYASLQEPNTLNPLLSDLLATAEVGSLIFSGLVINNEKGEWIPDLSMNVPTIQNGGVSRDGLTVTYQLRQGVQWHDGALFTAEDVKFTWQLIMNRKVNVVSREGYDKIKTIDTPTPNTVVVHFKEPYAPYLSLFRTILPKHLLSTGEDVNKAGFNCAPIGTGPFKFKEWHIAESIVLEANSSYFRGRPNLDRIVYRVLPDVNIMLSQLKNGELDIVSNIPFVQLDQVKAIDGVRAVMTPNMIWEHMDFNLEHVIFRDVRVRQAIALSIDRQAIVNNTLKGAAAVAVGDQSPLSWSYNPTLKPPTRDINTARDLLTQAGWKIGPNGIFVKDGYKLSFSLVIPVGVKSREAAAQVIVQQLKEVGIEVELRPVESQVFFNDILKNHRFEAAMYAWVAGVEPDNYSLWNSKQIPSAGNGYEGQNYPQWRNAEVDALTLQGFQLTDIEVRKNAYFRIQEIINAEYPVIPLYFRSNIDAMKGTVGNYQPNPTTSGNLWNAWQWYISGK